METAKPPELDRNSPPAVGCLSTMNAVSANATFAPASLRPLGLALALILVIVL